MAIRILPFRDYDEHDVVNLFKSAGALSEFIDLSDATKRSTPKGDAGVFVKVLAGTLSTSSTDWDPIDVDSSAASLLGKTDYPHVGRNLYPQANLSVTPTNAVDDECIGITLRQTVTRDENGENLLYNPIKKDELYGVLPGEAVPVLSKGMVTLTEDAFDLVTNATPAVGEVLWASAVGTVALGQVVSGTRAAAVTAGAKILGSILAIGYRDDETGAAGGTNVFGNAALQKGAYYIVKIDCA
jgi:hypothetical protein